MAEKLILDCDPGVDDALAILLALASPEVDLVGITTVVGNEPLDVVTHNALRIATLAGRSDVPVVAGCPRPILAPFRQGWASVHGGDGLGDTGLAGPGFAATPGHAVDFIIERVMRAPGEVTLCPIGPMTNVALAMIKEPRVVTAVRRIVFMGGAAFGHGNATPLAEFNVHVDPEAAAVVAASGAPLVMFGLDVTRLAKITPAWIATMAGGSPVQAEMAKMLRAYGSADPCLHDPCTVAYLVAPELFSGVEAHLSVATEGAARGATVAAVSPRHRMERAANATIMTGCDAAALLDLILVRLQAGFPARAPSLR